MSTLIAIVEVLALKAGPKSFHYRCSWLICRTSQKSMVCPPPDRTENIMEKWTVDQKEFLVHSCECSHVIFIVFKCLSIWSQFQNVLQLQ